MTIKVDQECSELGLSHTCDLEDGFFRWIWFL